MLKKNSTRFFYITLLQFTLYSNILQLERNRSNCGIKLAASVELMFASNNKTWTTKNIQLRVKSTKKYGFDNDYKSYGA